LLHALTGRADIVKSLCLPSFVLILAPTLNADEAFPLRDGDRVVLVGSTLIEREQRYGYWETALTRHYPNKSITFRNLGWSGDTVFGDARAGFGTQPDGFRHLKDHVLALKPTVIIIGYGTNESFEGPKGLPRFVKGLETLLDTFEPTTARIVLLSPLKQENLGPPLPDPTENNKNLHLYANAIRDMAKKRGHRFVDLYDSLGKEKEPLTDNGIHLTPWGYWRSAVVLERALGLSEADPQVQSARVTKGVGNPGLIQVQLNGLPLPPEPINGAPPEFTCVNLRQDVDDPSVWGLDPDIAQAEKLRQAIVAKNRLYFYRWRPENETYLFGFRKYEQGKNAREIPQFDPLIAEKEKEIAKLRVPIAHTYELKADKKP
jgi:lysophospholipase L1-like esterase